MCGIVGFFVPRGGAPVEPDLLEAMTSRLAHRGPDDEGYHIEDGVGLGFRRLSIIDLEGGHQPIFNESGSTAVIFNGEIYNFKELREDLRRSGHRFRTETDTEVLVHGWDAWGPEVVGRLRGMFAFAVWDRTRRSLFLARDRMGIKPLYYARLPDGRWTFGSELKALLLEPSLPRDIDPRAVEDYFSLGYVPDPRSILRSVAKLPPAHSLLLDDGEDTRPSRYWDVDFTERMNGTSLQEVEERLRHHLDDAVRSHLIADVPVGAFLSGGIDSSAVVSSMARVSDEVSTCSIAFGEAGFDESRVARSVAERYGTRHHEETVDPESFGLLDRLVDAYDEPFSDNSALPTYRLCQLARARVKVALSGDGGDETLAGYTRYGKFLSAVRARRLLPAPIRGATLRVAATLAEAAGGAERGAQRAASLRSLSDDPAAIYLRLVGASEAEERRDLFRPDFLRDLQGYRSVELLRQYYRDAPAEDPLARIQYVDMKTYLPGEILTKVDRASMAHSLEVRVPLLDHPWVAWAATLPRDLKMRHGVGKRVLRSALRDRLPEEVLARRKKGFSVPVSRWLRGPLRGEMQDRLLGQAAGASGILEPGAVASLVEEHLQARRDRGSILWALMMFLASWEKLHS